MAEIQKRTFDSERFPDLENMQAVTLRQSSRVSKVAKYSAIRDRHTGEVHHFALSIQTFRKKAGEQNYDKEHSVSLSSEGEDEIGRLFEFLQSVRGESPEPLENAQLLALLEARARENPQFLLEVLATLQKTLGDYLVGSSESSA